MTHKSPWTEQWKLFAPNFYDGKAHLDLSPFGTLELIPGGGFGDFSHPTTRMMIALMKGRVQGKHVFDIGCGSGILSLAAILMGSKSALGIDIEEEAVLHARENAILNHLNASFSQDIEQNLQKPLLIVMNMIFSEQKVAYQASYKFTEIITSGILKEQRESYLQWTTSLGWTLIQELEEDGWLSFVFH